MLQFLARMSIWEPKKPQSDQWGLIKEMLKKIRFSIGRQNVVLHGSRMSIWEPKKPLSAQ